MSDLSNWESQTCRACLLQDFGSAMYDLAVPEVEKLYTECTSTRIDVNEEGGQGPQFLCHMCYRICELWMGFKERAQESERKLSRIVRTKKTSIKPVQMSTSIITLQGTLTPKRERPSLKVEYAESEDGPEEELFIEEVETTPEDEEAHYEEEASEMDNQVWTEQLDYDSEPEVEEEMETTTIESPKTIPKQDKKRIFRLESVDDSISVKRRHRCKDPSLLTFGPGPNVKGVWQYFERDLTKSYAKCLICESVFSNADGSTGGLRRHMKKSHGMDIPTRTVQSKKTQDTDCKFRV